MANESGPREGVRGVVEDLKGKAKEAAGGLLGKEDLEREGQVQQERAREQREVAEHELRADKARADAETRRKQQETYQDR